MAFHFSCCLFSLFPHTTFNPLRLSPPSPKSFLSYEDHQDIPQMSIETARANEYLCSVSQLSTILVLQDQPSYVCK